MNTKQNNGILNQLMKSEPALFSALKFGDLTEGVVLEKKAGMLLVDLGKFGTGAVYRSEIQNAKELVKGLKVGDLIHGKVVNIDNEEGLVELSLMEAGRQKVWAEVAELKEKEEIIDVKPTAFNRGGLIAQVNGLQAFLPVSQLSTEHYPKVSLEDKTQIAVELQKLVGQELKVKIIDVNPRNNKFIISEKAAKEESVKELSKNYAVGQVVEGIISGVADFGAFLKFTDNPA
ncbi:MAG: S1 RNA-binding domain-containing protein, partial [Patescibacteria group bacterium]